MTVTVSLTAESQSVHGTRSCTDWVRRTAEPPAVTEPHWQCLKKILDNQCQAMPDPWVWIDARRGLAPAAALRLPVTQLDSLPGTEWWQSSWMTHRMGECEGVPWLERASSLIRGGHSGTIALRCEGRLEQRQRAQMQTTTASDWTELEARLRCVTASRRTRPCPGSAAAGLSARDTRVSIQRPRSRYELSCAVEVSPRPPSCESVNLY